VTAMAQAARTKFAADYGLAVGQLPTIDGQADQPPLLHFAIAGPKGTKAKSSPYVGHPDILKTRAAKQALNFLRLILLHANN
jgi:nicotinamide-nucleotide amidase